MQTDAPMMTNLEINLLKKILVCILFPKGKSQTKLPQNCSHRQNLKEMVYFHVQVKVIAMTLQFSAEEKF